ncbi:hypothetical protein T265_05350 [Opisthorchis viverrini]|uniref:Uncharacterized protein n=1 Tax=Opisthorchis viverrini TaxID=6198 RepID=A0A074ZKS1_OPIVI|nr:hypothetical protein T265_05350 [Opisthorchis viverrini]KER27631.1 hypothetical protein T265_05350 [Opisthorchis viverrini]
MNKPCGQRQRSNGSPSVLCIRPNEQASVVHATPTEYGPSEELRRVDSSAQPNTFGVDLSAEWKLSL